MQRNIPKYDEDVFIDEVAIRDTAVNISAVSDNAGYTPKTIIIYNSHNQAVTFQMQGSRDEEFSVSIDIGAPFSIEANTNDYVTLSDYFPYLRIEYNCTTTPMTGTVSAFNEKVAR